MPTRNTVQCHCMKSLYFFSNSMIITVKRKKNREREKHKDKIHMLIV